MTPRIPLSYLDDEATTLQFPRRYRPRWLWQMCAAIAITIALTLTVALVCAKRWL